MASTRLRRPRTDWRITTARRPSGYLGTPSPVVAWTHVPRHTNEDGLEMDAVPRGPQADSFSTLTCSEAQPSSRRGQSLQL